MVTIAITATTATAWRFLWQRSSGNKSGHVRTYRRNLQFSTVSQFASRQFLLLFPNVFPKDFFLLAALGSYLLTLASTSCVEGRCEAIFSLHKLHGMATPILYTRCAMSTHHPTCPQLSGMACGSLRDRGEVLFSVLDGRPESVLDGRNLSYYDFVKL